MSIFDAFRGQVSPTFSPQQAIMTIVVGAIRADGVVSDEEVNRLIAMCVLSPLFAHNTIEQDRFVIGYACNIYQSLGHQALAMASQALSPDLRETAFAFSSDMVLSDGLLTQNEENYLNWLKNALGIADDAAQSIIWATLVRNRSR